MSAGLREGVSRDEETWTWVHALLDGLPYRGIGAAAISDGGEATLEHGSEDLRLAEDRGVGVQVLHRGEVFLAGHGGDVHVAVN